MSDATTQEIKSKIDIAEYLRGFITLIPAGKNFKAVCPFHKEKTPSFMVSPDRQTWHCFGACNTGGDIFTFLMKYENLEFFEALKVLAEKAGVELKHADPAEQRQFGVLYDINSIAKNFFMDELALPGVAKSARDYLQIRGLKPEILHEFEIGFALNKPDALVLHLIHKGVNVADIERSGLAFKADRGGYMDRFRGRIMFPIANHFGKTVGFTGRVLPEFDTGTMGKYVNSPETAIFKKSKLLYGFYKTKNAIREANTALLVEGQMDFLMSYQDGVKNVVATSGTALTSDHLTVLRKYADKLILSFDSDSAGATAADRAIHLADASDFAGVIAGRPMNPSSELAFTLAAASDFEVNVFMLPQDAKDPAEVVEKYPGTLSSLIQKAVPMMEFYIEHFLKDGINKKSVRLVLGKIKQLSSALDRSTYLRLLANRSSFSEKDLSEEMEQLKTEAQPAVRGTDVSGEVLVLPPEKHTRWGTIAEHLITLAISKSTLPALLPQRQYFPDRYQKVFDALQDPAILTDPALTAFVNTLSLKAGSDLPHDETILTKELHREYLKEQIEELQKSIIHAEQTGRDATEFIKKVDVLSRELHN
ncbi:MAG: DNA primase [bacterium]|nr:DNA primase [bacterium]